jgi:hypothetical protein
VVGAIPEFNKEYLKSVGIVENLQKWQELCHAYLEEYKDEKE